MAQETRRDGYDQHRDIIRLVDGATVSIDMSTGDLDSEARVFGRVYSAQREDDGSLTLLAEVTEDNRRPTGLEARERLARHLYATAFGGYLRTAGEQEWDAGTANPRDVERCRADAAEMLAVAAGEED